MDKNIFKIQVVIATDRPRGEVERLFVILVGKLGIVRGVRFLPTNPKGRGKPIGMRRIAELTLHAQPSRKFLTEEVSDITGQSMHNTWRSLQRSLNEGSVVYTQEGDDVFWQANPKWVPPVEDGVE